MAELWSVALGAANKEAPLCQPGPSGQAGGGVGQHAVTQGGRQPVAAPPLCVGWGVREQASENSVRLG